jgi:hypothetical protein
MKVIDAIQGEIDNKDQPHQRKKYLTHVTIVIVHQRSTSETDRRLLSGPGQVRALSHFAVTGCSVCVLCWLVAFSFFGLVLRFHRNIDSLNQLYSLSYLFVRVSSSC